MRKKSDKQKAIAELDKWFSLFIRLRVADERGMVRCFTSGTLVHYKEAQAGHFVSRRYMATRWDEMNVQVQSVSENIFNQGNNYEFGKRLNRKYGPGTADRLIIKKNNICKIGLVELNLLIAEYKKKVELLMK